jgi:ABC-2 type transport system ATP-binding protein
MDETEILIDAQKLTKFYGEYLAIADISFSVRRGEIVGLLGPNGSGKTTTMRILTGYMPPTSGDVRIAGKDIMGQSLEARRHIGYLPETVPLYTDMSVTDYLRFMGLLRGMERERISLRITEAIEMLKLGDYRHTHIGKLSKGYRQRVGLAQAVLHEPEVLILDEPTIGIDPIQIVETRQLIKELGREHTILISTHILPEVSMLCSRVLIIHDGALVAEDTPANLGKRLHNHERVELDVRGPVGEITSALRGLPGVTGLSLHNEGDVNSFVVESRSGDDQREKISHLIAGKGWGLLRLNSVSMSLEEIFIQLTARDEEA